MRPTRVLYVENDPTLRAILAGVLADRPELELVATHHDANEALAEVDATKIDVALLDLALGSTSLNGIELGLALRERNPNMGVVLFTQHVVPDYLAGLPEAARWGWSYIEKRGVVDFDWLVDVLRSTARGLNVVDPTVQLARSSAAPSVIEQLSVRQREILALISTGLDATAVGEQLGVGAASVRQDLSRAYAILVPDPRPGTDLRTAAVLRYLRETRTYAQAADEQ